MSVCKLTSLQSSLNEPVTPIVDPSNLQPLIESATPVVKPTIVALQLVEPVTPIVDPELCVEIRGNGPHVWYTKMPK
jgi:hypothetical protein